jgi:hypothetical protein
MLAMAAGYIERGSDAACHASARQTVWIDIGLGRDVAMLTPKQIADLRRCKEPTMAFQREEDGWVLSFYSGIEMRTVYASAMLKTELGRKIVLFYTAGRGTPAETLVLHDDAAVEQTRGFRPRTFLKCKLRELVPRRH